MICKYVYDIILYNIIQTSNVGWRYNRHRKGRPDYIVWLVHLYTKLEKNKYLGLQGCRKELFKGGGGGGGVKCYSFSKRSSFAMISSLTLYIENGIKFVPKKDPLHPFLRPWYIMGYFDAIIYTMLLTIIWPYAKCVSDSYRGIRSTPD